MAEEKKAPLRIMRDAEVTHVTGLGNKTRYSMTKRGDFPSPVWITGRSKGGARGYLSDDIEAWLESRRDKKSIQQDRPWTPENP